MRAGSLVVVGVGMKFVNHLTPEARTQIEHADQVFLVLGDPAAIAFLENLNPRCTRLQLYQEREPNQDTAREWQEQVGSAIDRLLAPATEGATVCLVLDGHPGVMVPPVHEALRRAKERGLGATLLPAVSAEDCLFADLGIDPARHGCQSFEATDFLIRHRPASITSVLILRQIGLIGEFMLMGRRNQRGIQVLTEVLTDSYGPSHQVAVYEAAPFWLSEPVVQWVPLERLPGAAITDFSTLYVPPVAQAAVDTAMLDRLGIPPSRVRD